MEFEDMSEKIAWEARRVAAAFGLEKWMCRNSHSGAYASFEGNRGEVEVSWDIERDSLRLDIVRLDQGGCWSQIEDGKNGSWLCDFDLKHGALLARGLYCLGIEDEGVSTTLNYQLSAHEKLELGLSLPCEFWPQKWVEEER